jgi:hypothetical protein
MLPHPTLQLTHPHSAKCAGCHITKNIDAFAKSQRDSLKEKIHNNPRFNATVSEWMACLQCNKQQQDEFQCWDCDVWKERAKFDKAQLKGEKRDTAVRSFVGIIACT